MTALKTFSGILALLAAAICCDAKTHASSYAGGQYFIENKGQIRDQNNNGRADIQYMLHGKGVNIFIGSDGLHYQFSRKIKGDLKPEFSFIPTGQKSFDDLQKSAEENSRQVSFETYRLDVSFEGANRNAKVVAEDIQPYYERYYVAGINGDVQAHTCRKLTYKDIYPGIDWVLYIRGEQLEHEFVVNDGANAAAIRLKYNGQTSLKINKDGSITANTPLGNIREHAPVCFNEDGEKVPSSFRLNGSMLSYDVKAAGKVIVDPVVEWGTYYGPDSTTTDFYQVVADGSANLYASGLSWAATAIATTGSFQSTYGGGCDAFLVKFDSSGNRLWATYYGGAGGDWGVAVTCDTSGMVYLAGVTESSTGISTPGTQQVSFGGGSWDGFIAKFDPSGTRLWGTYCGGPGTNYVGTVATDKLGHVYIAGVTNDNTNTATPGGFHPTKSGGYDDYLVQYNTTNGVRNWGTYYGGTADEFQGNVCSDGNYVYITGFTSSSTTIATPLSHQETIGGSNDAFVAKFQPDGTRLWGTYFGGAGAETMGGITCDKNGYIYLLGNTSSDDAIATPGCFQGIRAGGIDAFLAKFEPEVGQLIWATYFGGPAAENTDKSKMACDDSDHVYIIGYTPSTSGVASPGAWQTVYGGGDDDAFFAKFNGAGTRLWSTYFGGTLVDIGEACAFDGKCVYICGRTSSPDHIATPGSFQPTGGGYAFYYFGFLAKFNINDTGIILQTRPQQSGADIAIYPVPNNGTFTLSGTLTTLHGIAQIFISDVAGRIVYTSQSVIQDGKIDQLVQLPIGIAPGEYLLKITSDEGTNVLKFVKQ